MSGRALRWLLSWGVRDRYPRRGPPRLTIVRHHRVYADGDRPLYALGVSESVFRGQLRTCADAGLTPTGVAEGLERLERGTPGQAIAFSFDDGYADNVTRALPELARHGARATFYLTAGLMESRTAPWWDELAYALEHARVERAGVTWGGRTIPIETGTRSGRVAALPALLPALRVAPEEQRSRLDSLRQALGVTGAAPCDLAEWPLARRLCDAGMEVGAHTLAHPFLSLLGAARQREEIERSAALVRERLGAPVTGLAYPNGDHDARTVEAARACGLAYAVTTRAGDCCAEAPRWTLPRRALPEGACVGPGSRFSARMTRAELAGGFDRLRRRDAEAAS